MFKLSAHAKLLIVAILLLGVIALRAYGQEVARIFCQAQINQVFTYYGNTCPYINQVMVGSDYSNPHQPMVRCGQVYVSCF